jgi:hypothetical protein
MSMPPAMNNAAAFINVFQSTDLPHARPIGSDAG